MGGGGSRGRQCFAHTQGHRRSPAEVYIQHSGARMDALNAYLVGLERACQAVEVSRRAGGYTGPDAVTLVKAGAGWFDAGPAKA